MPWASETREALPLAYRKGRSVKRTWSGAADDAEDQPGHHRGYGAGDDRRDQGGSPYRPPCRGWCWFPVHFTRLRPSPAMAAPIWRRTARGTGSSSSRFLRTAEAVMAATAHSHPVLGAHRLDLDASVAAAARSEGSAFTLADFSRRLDAASALGGGGGRSQRWPVDV